MSDCADHSSWPLLNIVPPFDFALKIPLVYWLITRVLAEAQKRTLVFTRASVRILAFGLSICPFILTEIIHQYRKSPRTYTLYRFHVCVAQASKDPSVGLYLKIGIRTRPVDS